MSIAYVMAGRQTAQTNDLLRLINDHRRQCTSTGWACLAQSYFSHSWLHFCVYYLSHNMKTVVAKWQKEATAAVSAAMAAGKQQPNILYMQRMRDDVQQTAMQYRKIGMGAGHITFSVQSGRTVSEPLGRARFAHYISYILFSVLRQIVSTANLIYESVYIHI